MQSGGPAQFSPDGRWWWDGRQWNPVVAPVGSAFPAGNPGYGGPSSPDGKAIASLVAAIVWMAGLGSILAVVLGHLSRSESRREGRQPSGVALAGLIIGYFGIASMILFITAAIAIPVFFAQTLRGRDVAVKSTLRTAVTAEELFQVDNNRYTKRIADLETYGFSPRSDIPVLVLSAGESDFCLTARSTVGGKRFYFQPGHGISETSCE
ncbi:MAG: DUF4190 domain-containing protein [Actinomycetota bacterium]